MSAPQVTRQFSFGEVEIDFEVPQGKVLPKNVYMLESSNDGVRWTVVYVYDTTNGTVYYQYASERLPVVRGRFPFDKNNKTDSDAWFNRKLLTLLKHGCKIPRLEIALKRLRRRPLVMQVPFQSLMQKRPLEKVPICRKQWKMMEQNLQASFPGVNAFLMISHLREIHNETPFLMGNHAFGVEESKDFPDWSMLRKLITERVGERDHLEQKADLVRREDNSTQKFMFQLPHESEKDQASSKSSSEDEEDDSDLPDLISDSD